MMMLTGQYKGEAMKNYFGRIVRIPEKDHLGNHSPKEDIGKVLAIFQFQDIISMKKDEQKYFNKGEHTYSFGKEQLLNIMEFDSGAFAFRYSKLKPHLKKLTSKNVQSEYYITDFVEIFNAYGLGVGSISSNDPLTIMGFNDKSVWKELEAIFRNKCFQKLKNIVHFEDEIRFFLAEKNVNIILNRDNGGTTRHIHWFWGLSGRKCRIAK